MRIPRYWAKARVEGQDAKGRKIWMFGLGYSDDSPEDAMVKARTRAQQAITRFVNRSFEKADRYLYHDRPLREEILEEITSGGKRIGVITRNAYGCKVLNAASAMFIDIDFPAPNKGLLDKLFGKKEPDQEPVYLEKVKAWQAGNPQYSLKVYRTSRGLRCFIINKLIDPLSEESRRILNELGSDKQYTTLCKVQECYRARLTPKHWRCSIPPPPNRYPWDNAAAEQKFRAWENNYQTKTSKYTTCKVLATLGGEGTNAETAMIMDSHDRVACGGHLPLA